jgi:hypothetical protein
MTALTAVLLLYEPAGKYPRALERLIAVLERLRSVEAKLIVVDNGREGDWQHQVSSTLLQIGGDNRAWEFSAFDKALAVCDRWRPETEVVALVTDAFAAYGQEYLELIDDRLISCVTRLAACAGWMDSYGFERCRIGSLAYDTWMRSSFLFLPREHVGLVSPLAADLDSDELFGSEPERPFADGGPLSENLKELLLEWLTARSAGSRRLSEHWHSRLELSAETLPLFHGKVRAILREHLISARLEAAGVACYDFRLLRRLADEGRLEDFLDQGGDRDRQWLGWLRPTGAGEARPSGEVAASASPPVAAEAAGEEATGTPELPGIHHYWSNRYLRPKLQRFGFDSPNDLFRTYTEKLCRTSPTRRQRFVSIGGSQEFEVELAVQLLARGLPNFVLECTGVSPALLERSKRLAERHGVASHLDFSTAGFDPGRPAAPCDAVLANQGLPADGGLEELLAGIREGLAPGGYFLAHGILAPSGYQRGSEALGLIQRLWVELPKRYRYNRLLDRFEMQFPDHDPPAQEAIVSGARQILPLLLGSFHFELFIGFANLIDPFIGRSFGPNFDPDRETDRAFIDRVHAADEEAQRTGRIKPRHMLAAMTVADTGIELCDGGLTAQLAAQPTGAR